MTARLAMLAIFLLAAAASLAAGVAGVRHAEAALAARTERALAAGGAAWARIEVDGLTARLSGVAPDESARAAALRTVARAAPELTVDMAALVRAAPTRETPAWQAEILAADGEILLAGRLSRPDAAALEAALRAAGDGVGAFLTIAAEEANVAPWVWETAARAAAALAHGRVTVREGEIAVHGLAADEEAARAIDRLGGGAPAGWRVSADVAAPSTEAPAPEIDLAEPPPPPAPVAPTPPRPAADYELEIAVAADGVTISGMAPGGTAAESLRAYARAAFPASSPGMEVLRGEAPARKGWRRAAMAAIDALALLENGRARIGGGAVRLTGAAASPAALRAAHERLTAGGWPAESRITLSPSRTAAAQPLPVGRCVERLAALSAEQPLSFEPAEFRLTPDGEAALARLIPVIRRCAGARIEIGGHTDSQGRETTNMALSRARAETVLDRLIAAGAPPGLLSARGYGETRPVASNADESGRARNRRIEFTLPEAEK